jgi:hypothetical protein
MMDSGESTKPNIPQMQTQITNNTQYNQSATNMQFTQFNQNMQSSQTDSTYTYPAYNQYQDYGMYLAPGMQQMMGNTNGMIDTSGHYRYNYMTYNVRL